MNDETQPMTITQCLERAMYEVWRELGDTPTGFSLSPHQFRQFEMSLDPIQWDYRNSERDTIIWQSPMGTFTVTRDWSARPTTPYAMAQVATAMTTYDKLYLAIAAALTEYDSLPVGAPRTYKYNEIIDQLAILIDQMEPDED